MGTCYYLYVCLPFLLFFFQDLSRWTDGSCRECECRDAQVTCYLRSCTTCPPGIMAVTQEGRCCPECHQGVLTCCKRCWVFFLSCANPVFSLFDITHIMKDSLCLRLLLTLTSKSPFFIKRWPLFFQVDSSFCYSNKPPEGLINQL